MKTYGWGGQSNMTSSSDVDDLAGGPPSAPSLARLWFYKEDLWDYTDDVGQFEQMVFAAGQLGVPTNGFDYPQNWGQPLNQYFYNCIAAEVYAGVALADYHATDLLNVKLAPPGTILDVRDNISAGVDAQTGWFQSASHTSWSIDLPRDVTPWIASVKDTGTATSVTATTLVDTTKSWVPGAFAAAWVTMGGSTGFCIGNTATVLNIYKWRPEGAGAPAAGAYVVEYRKMQPAGLARHFIEGYVPGAVAAAAALPQTIEFEGFFLAQGESDAMVDRSARLYKANLLDLIWYFRESLDALGLLPGEMYEFKWVSALIKSPSIFWTLENGILVNNGMREIAYSDPQCGVVDVADVSLGGTNGSDQIHYDANGQKVLGTNMGAEMVRLHTAPFFSRRSHAYVYRHEVFRPVWGITIGGKLARYVATVAEIMAVDPSSRTGPLFYTLRDGRDGCMPLYLDEDGREINNLGGEPIGYGLIDPAVGSVCVAAVQIPDTGRPRRMYRGARASEMASGHIWLAGDGSGTFSEEQVDVEGAGDHQIHLSRACGGLPKRWSTFGSFGTKNWLLRGACGQFGINAQLRIREKVGRNSHYWMRHHLTQCGDYRTPHASSMPIAGLAPSLPVSITPTKWTGGTVAMEWAPDTLAPPKFAESGETEDLAQIQVTHAGSSALQDAVLWPGVRITHEITPNWHGIEGVFRFVWTVEADFDLGTAKDTLELEPTVWCNGTVMDDDQFVYDIDTATLTSLGWGAGTNRYQQFSATDKWLLNEDGTVNAKDPPDFVRGLIGWMTTDGFLASWYVDLRNDGSLATAGNKAHPTPANDPTRAVYDQLNYAFFRYTARLQGQVIQAGAPWRVATFLVVGSQVKTTAAADQLSSLGVNASWVD